jgi:hypothetical protein
MAEYRIEQMAWHQVGDHFHPALVTYVNPDGTRETTQADRVPFTRNRVEVEGQGVVVRSGICTKCGQRVMPAIA